MLKARKKNRVVRIPEEKAGEYKKLGYTITDENGKTVYQPEDKDATIAALRKENQQLMQKITEYELLLKQANGKKAPEAEKPAEEPAAPEEPAEAEEPKQQAPEGKNKGRGKGASKDK